MPIEFGASKDEVLQCAYRSYTEERSAIQTRVARKLDLTRQFDIQGMNRAAAICHCGRSGSFLLASYLDDHPDVVTLPHGHGEYLYPFFLEYEALSLWEKLIAYPAYSAAKAGTFGDFFLKNNPNGDFAIDAPEYFAAVQALFATYGDRPMEWLHARARFLQFIHVAFSIAVGKPRANSRPLIIYSQHWMNDELARRFVEDFPEGRFIHTIRDPITSVDSWFNWKLDKAKMDNAGNLRTRPIGYSDAAVATLLDLFAWDRPHRGMELRTCAIRFEDMHLAPEAMMRRLAEWLDIPFDPCLLKSTWNGNPYIVNIRGVPCCGANPANAQRRSKNLAKIDRLMLFALLSDNFAAWNYPSPSAMRRRWIRLCTIVLISLVPMKMELMNARLVLQLQALPFLRRGQLGPVCGALFFVMKRRLRMMLLIAAEARARLRGQRFLLKVL
jgi:hypothetical protein